MLGDCSLWVDNVKMTEVAQIIVLLFPVVYLVLQKNVNWATFWATFSQEHLVTLLLIHGK
jgi:ABC-type sulfate transport system permease component